MGYLKEQRKNKAVEKGIFPPDKKIVDSMSTLDSWSALDQESKKMIIKSMAVFAGMLDAMDFHIGRFMTYLKKKGFMKIQSL